MKGISKLDPPILKLPKNSTKSILKYTFLLKMTPEILRNLLQIRPKTSGSCKNFDSKIWVLFKIRPPKKVARPRFVRHWKLPPPPLGLFSSSRASCHILFLQICLRDSLSQSPPQDQDKTLRNHIIQNSLDVKVNSI